MSFLGVMVVCLFVHAAIAVHSPDDEPDFTHHHVSSVTKLLIVPDRDDHYEVSIVLLPQAALLPLG